MEDLTTSVHTLLQVTVAAKVWLADGIAGYELSPVSGDALPAFEAGAHIDLHVPGGPVRQYSLYELPGEHRLYRIGVLRDPNSRGGSVKLLDDVQAGDTLTISAPRNHFALHSAANDRSILFAGGIGITPIFCMAQQLANEQRPFELHYCGRTLSGMAFVDRLQQVQFGGESNVHVHVDDGTPDQQLDARSAIGAPSADKHLYVCGPAGFMDHILATARELGWDEKHLHREYFAAATPVESSSDDKPFEIEIGSSGEVIKVAADQSAAQALLEAGFDLPLSCEQGVCGTCMTKVLAGVPEHRDLYLTDEERERNDAFMPCCSRSKTSRLTLEL
jgi:vanillate monooxygenase ferredoxin subunit